MTATGRKLSNHRLRLATRLQVSIAIGKPNHRVDVGDVNPFGIRAGRIESDAEGLIEAGGEDLGLARLVEALSRSQNFDAARVRFRREYVAVGRDPQRPGAG